jgi:hypothetical protein
MQDQVNMTKPPKRVPWNKGKLTGAKPPLRPKHVWSIRTKLQIEGRARDLAMFNLAIDSRLRGCDVVAIRVEDVAAGGYTADPHESYLDLSTHRQSQGCPASAWTYKDREHCPLPRHRGR